MKLMRLLMCAVILGASVPANALWKGRLDLNSSVQAMVLREAHDGQWLAGYAHPNLVHLDHNDNLLFHVGVFNAFNAEHGNGSFGLLVGADLTGISKDLGVDIPATIASVGDFLNIPSVFKPAVLFASFLSVDTFAGYRPIHTADVSGSLVYGGAACLKIPFGVQELKQGL